MNNKIGISNKDWINLSAYIDGALSEIERARLDKSLAESKDLQQELANLQRLKACLLYTSDAADDLLCVDLGGRRIIKKKTTKPHM